MTRCFQWWALGLCLALFISSGCRKPAGVSGTGGESADPEAGQSAVAASSSGKTDKKIIPINREVKGFEGNWVMVVTLGPSDRYSLIMKVTRNEEGKFQGEIINRAEGFPATELQSFSIDDKTMRFSTKNEMGILDYEGLFDGVAFRGTIEENGTQLFPSRLLSTRESSLKDYVESALPPGTDVFQKAIESMKQQPQPREILRIAGEYRSSPITLEAISSMLTLVLKSGGPDELVHETINEYLKTVPIWGPRMNGRGELVVAEQLVLNSRMPEEALKHLARSEELLKDSLGEAGQSRLNAFRDTAKIQISLAKSKSASEEDRAAAHLELAEALSKQPFNHEILLALATRAESLKQPDAAIEYLTDIVGLPLLEQMILSQRTGQPPSGPTPSESLKKLWVEKHGNDEKLKDHVIAISEKKVNSWIEDVRSKGPSVPKDEGSKRTVLVELFTGGQCPPCIAADLGLTALARTYPTTDVVTLRYHQHTPGPDPLTNQDGEDRFAAYERASTPTLVVDGMVLDSNQVQYTGPMQMTPVAYSTLRHFVDGRRRMPATMAINLSAAVTNGELTLNAEATGASEDELVSLRLRMAIVEESVTCQMPNGIRKHEMLVREMPGGARGIAAKKGQLKYSFSMPFADVQRHNDEHIQRFESGNKVEFPKEMKPSIDGRMFFVAWVQNDKVDKDHPIREVHQVSIVPITGLGEEAVDPTPALNEKATSEASNAEKKSPPPVPALPE